MLESLVQHASDGRAAVLFFGVQGVRHRLREHGIVGDLQRCAGLGAAVKVVAVPRFVGQRADAQADDQPAVHDLRFAFQPGASFGVVAHGFLSGPQKRPNTSVNATRHGGPLFHASGQSVRAASGALPRALTLASMPTYIAIPAVESEVSLGGRIYHPCIRPQLDGQYLHLGNFRPEEDSLIYARSGPYISFCVRDVDFVSLLANSPATLPKPFTDGPRWFGEMWMVGGRTACDFPDERRWFENLSISWQRYSDSTKLSFKGLLGPRKDPGNWPPTMTLDMWFTVPDAELDRFILGAEANGLFRNLIS